MLNRGLVKAVKIVFTLFRLVLPKDGSGSDTFILYKDDNVDTYLLSLLAR